MDVGGGDESITDSRRPSMSPSMPSSSSTVSTEAAAAAAAVRRLLHRRVPRPVEFIKGGHDDASNDDDEASDDDASGDDASDDDASDDDGDSSSSPVDDDPTPSSSSCHPPSLESLPPDVSSRILTHLLPHELHPFALASRRARAMFDREELWRDKFSRRWNCVPDPLHRADASPPDGGGGGWRLRGRFQRRAPPPRRRDARPGCGVGRRPASVVWRQWR